MSDRDFAYPKFPYDIYARRLISVNWSQSNNEHNYLIINMKERASDKSMCKKIFT